MLNQVIQICQLKNLIIVGLIIFMLIGCSRPEQKNYSEKVHAVSSWFSTDKRFSFMDEDGKPTSHPFFDLVPFSSMKDNSINFVVQTFEGSQQAYGFDMISGRFFKKYYLCEQEDVWQNYKGVISTPPFTEGFIPRLLDQIGEPQKIIVFGDKKEYAKYKGNYNVSHRVRVVGGVIEQRCSRYPCLTKDKWISRFVLVGVDPLFYKYERVSNLYQLKKVVDWSYVKAFMENYQGRTFDGGMELPYIRIVDEIEPEKSLKFVINKGHLFKFKEMIAIRDSCHQLYDHIWKSVEKLRDISSKLSDEKFIARKVEEGLKKQKRKTVTAGIEVQRMKAEIIRRKFYLLSRDSFANFFRDFHGRFKDKYQTCIKYVRPANITNNMERHWFFAYFSSFFRLEQLGYIYSCDKSEWFKNYIIGRERLAMNQKKELLRCSTKLIEKSFEKAVAKFRYIMNKRGDDYHRYITYDFFDGTHQKLYSWVPVTGKMLSCKSSSVSMWKGVLAFFKKKKSVVAGQNPDYIFPADVNWKKFQPKKSFRMDLFQ